MDADKIHDYVFSPHELRLIRGGSVLQSTLNMETLPELAADDYAGNLVYAGGGTTLVSFAGEKEALNFCAAAEACYAERTAIGTATSAWIEVGEREFPETRDRLFGLLERRKNARNAHQRPEGSPFSELCSACGEYAAAVRDPEPERERRICLACLQRLVWSGRPTLLPAGRKPTKDLTKVGGLAQPAGYIAVVYIDLDRAGAFLRDRATTMKAYGELSRGMRDR